MIPEFLRNRKTYMLTALVFTIIGVLSLSYAFFSRQSLLGESSNNTINIQTIEGTTQSFITTYQNGSNEIKTGILNLTDTPYTKMSKFEVHNVYDYSLNVTINWDYVSSTLIQSDSSYNLYECSSINFVTVTMDNVGSTCTLVSPTTGNVLPNTGEASRLQSDSDITMAADQTRYYVATITIGVSNNGRNFQGIIKTKDRFKHTLTIDYDNGSDSTNMDMSSGDEIDLPTVIKTGYTFDKWQMTVNYDSSLNGSTVIMGSEDTTVKAIWNANTYTITYDCNGGINLITSTTHTYDTLSNISDNACYKLTDGNSGMVYAISSFSYGLNTIYPGDEILTLTSEPNGEVTLMANWENLFTYSGSYTVIDDTVNGSPNSYGNWRVKFLTSGSLIMNYSTTIDLFLVGGGGGGGDATGLGPAGTSGGGGGGYTDSFPEITTEAITYPITIGDGGTKKVDGGTTSALNNTVSGGNHGTAYHYYGGGGSGGSGGAANTYSGGGCVGAVDGASGCTKTGKSLADSSPFTAYGGTGQGSSTREFFELDQNVTATLYSTGGSTNVSGVMKNPNTGDGGDKQNTGGSGIVIIRNHR